MGACQSDATPVPRPHPQARPQHLPPPPAGPLIQVMQNDISLHKDSIKFIDSASGGSKKTLTFSFDSRSDAAVTVYLLVREKSDQISEFTLLFEPLLPNTPAALTRIMPGGTNLQFPAECVVLSVEGIPRDTLFTKKENEFGLVIRLEKKDPSGAERKAMYNYCELDEEGGKIIARVKRQKMEMNGQAYEIQEIYGIDASDLEAKKARATMADTNKECSVCLNEKIDTIILPCRHMCLCGSCASELSKKPTGRKCPICREQSHGFVRLTRQNNQNGLTMPRPDIPEPQLAGIPPRNR